MNERGRSKRPFRKPWLYTFDEVETGRMIAYTLDIRVKRGS